MLDWTEAKDAFRIPFLRNITHIKNKVDSESWLDKTIPNVEIFPPGFTVYPKDRHGHGGGVFILISHALSSTQILFENSSESVWCLVKLPNGNNVVYGTFYRPPGSSDSFGLLSEMLSLLPNSVSLGGWGGDFNFPDFNWNVGCVAGNRSRIYTEFEELLGLNGLQQYVLEPTREIAILDLVLCNEPNIISKVTVCPGYALPYLLLPDQNVLDDFQFHPRGFRCGACFLSASWNYITPAFFDTSLNTSNALNEPLASSPRPAGHEEMIHS
ncbi:uncharacterized protein LOC142574334 [Dermacentor variabilis]|uniref:uncharacterized protein LOC142574334 n=1 Tax=Dermacentor variabilis TaxID=34621 RepID=UPI003F5B00DE